MSIYDATYSGRTVKIVKELREKFDLARNDHNSPFAHPVCCNGSTAVDFVQNLLGSTHRRSCLESMRSFLSKHEGHGQLLLCALICKKNGRWCRYCQCSKESLRVSKSVRDPVSASLLQCVPMGTGQQKNAVEATHNDNKRERAEENLHDAESGGSDTNWWYLEARRGRRCWLITDPPHWGSECGTEPGKERRRRRR